LYRLFDARWTRIASAVLFGSVLLNLGLELTFGTPADDLRLGAERLGAAAGGRRWRTSLAR